MQLYFDYILFHFKRVYQLPEPLEMSYGIDGSSRLQIKPTQGQFFSKKLAQPEAIIWKEWEGTSLPLFFDTTPESGWFTEDAQGNVVVAFDLIASAFYLLSGWQEYYSQERDTFGRFPYRASVQFKCKFVIKPIVNYYFDILKAAVERAYGQEIQPRFWHGKAFATCLTHDIDYCQSAWKVAGRAALQRRNVGLFLQLSWQKLMGKDAWFNLPKVEQELSDLNAKATFFFLTERALYQGHPNADYDICSPHLQREISR